MSGSKWNAGIVVLGVLLAGGCGGDGLTDVERERFGAYTLAAINAAPLPFALGRSCGDRVERGYLELGQENRFYVEMDVSKPGCPGEAERTWAGTGIWTVIDGNVRLVSDPRTDRAISFGAAPAVFAGGELKASGRLEGEGFQSPPLTFTLTLEE